MCICMSLLKFQNINIKRASLINVDFLKTPKVPGKYYCEYIPTFFLYQHFNRRKKNGCMDSLPKGSFVL